MWAQGRGRPMFCIGQAPLRRLLLPSSGPNHFDGPTFFLISDPSFVLSGEILSLEEEGKGSRGNPGREDQRGWCRGAGADPTLSLAGNQPNVVTSQKLDPARKMSGRQVSRSNTYNRLSQPNNISFPPRTPGWTQYPNMNNGKGPRSRLPSGSESSTSGQSEQSLNSASPGLPLGKICMGRPYNSRCVETSHLMRGPKVVKKPTCHRSSPHCLICTDRPSCPSSPTFLDQLIKGISYLDRSTNVFNNSSYPKALSLPQLAATYLERAANSLYLDQTERPPPRSYSTPSTSMATANHPPASNCLVPSTRDTKTLQCLGGSSALSYQQRPNNQTFNVEMPQRPGVKLPEIPLFGNGFFSLGRLPKFWEAIRSGWNAPAPTPKPEGWW